MDTSDSRTILVVCMNPTFQKTLVLPQLIAGEVNRCTAHYLDASGKGMNTARLIGQLGGTAIHLTHLGGNRVDEMLDLLHRDGIETSWLQCGSPIRTCTTIVDLGAGTTTELVEEPQPVEPQCDARARERFSVLLDSIGAVVITGTRAPGYSSSLYADMVRLAKSAGKLVVLDIKGRDLKECIAWGPDVIKPNLSEFAATFLGGLPVYENQDNEHIKETVSCEMKRLFHTHGVKTAVTRGSRPLWLYDGQGFSEIPVEAVHALNTIGCGDAVTAGIARSLVEGHPFREAVSIGLAAGTQNARTIRPGNLSAPTRESFGKKNVATCFIA